MGSGLGKGGEGRGIYYSMVGGMGGGPQECLLGSVMRCEGKKYLVAECPQLFLIFFLHFCVGLRRAGDFQLFRASSKIRLVSEIIKATSFLSIRWITQQKFLAEQHGVH